MSKSLPVNVRSPSPSRNSVAHGEEGFTLVEVLVALVILGLTIAMLTASIADSLARAERVENEDHGAVLADTILAQLGEDIPVHSGITQGREQNLFWRIVIAPEPDSLQVLHLDEVDLTISYGSNHIVGHWQTLRLAQ